MNVLNDCVVGGVIVRRDVDRRVDMSRVGLMHVSVDLDYPMPDLAKVRLLLLTPRLP